MRGDPGSKALFNVEISVLKKAKLPLPDNLALISAAVRGYFQMINLIMCDTLKLWVPKV